MDGNGTTLTPEQQEAWRKVQQAKDTIVAWIQEQYDIDGDYVQVSEILDEWFGKFRTLPDPDSYVERVYDLLRDVRMPDGRAIDWSYNMMYMEDWSTATPFNADTEEGVQEFIEALYDRLKIDLDFFMISLARYHKDHPVKHWRNYDD